MHADAVIGWAGSVFNDYDFEANPLGFRPRTIRALAGVRHHIQHVNLAESIGINSLNRVLFRIFPAWSCFAMERIFSYYKGLRNKCRICINSGVIARECLR